jgi:hypothetical protein
MKAIKNILAGFAIALLILGGTAFASQADSSALYDNATMILPEEEYVNDIPFNTAKIAAEAQYQKAIQVPFTVPEEEEVNDIPFDTHKIAMKALHQKALNQVFLVAEEKYVNDIPFSTEKVFQLLQANKQLLTILK